jgi:hypothetical protein
VAEDGRSARALKLHGAALVALAILALCTHPSSRLDAVDQIRAWLLTDAMGAPAMVSLSLLAWMLRVAWLLWRQVRLARGLPRAPAPPAALAAAIARTGCGPLLCVTGAGCVAFCAGALRPVVVIGDELASRLRPAELDAVLIHEQDHVNRREPLRRAVCHAAADVLFYAPLVRWWAERQAARAELRADRAAIERLGRRPVAGALLALGSSRQHQLGTVAFAGGGRLRVAQVLGEPVTQPAPRASTVALSWLGTCLALGAFACLLQLALGSLP